MLGPPEGLDALSVDSGNCNAHTEAEACEKIRSFESILGLVEPSYIIATPANKGKSLHRSFYASGGVMTWAAVQSDVVLDLEALKPVNYAMPRRASPGS